MGEPQLYTQHPVLGRRTRKTFAVHRFWTSEPISASAARGLPDSASAEKLIFPHIAKPNRVCSCVSGPISNPVFETGYLEQHGF
jgi:hypothetical protein